MNSRTGAISTIFVLACALAFPLAFALAGCAGVTEGPPEQIKVATIPGGADCVLERRGETIGRIQGTPGFTTIRKASYNITVRCKKSGYRDATYIIHSGAAGVLFGSTGHDTMPAPDKDYDHEHDGEYDVVVYLKLLPVGASTRGIAPVQGASRAAYGW